MIEDFGVPEHWCCMSELTVLYVRIQDVRTDVAVCQDPRCQNWWCCIPENVNLYHHFLKKVTSHTALRSSYSRLTLWKRIQHILPAIDLTAHMDALKKYHKTACTHKPSWGWTLGCLKHVADTVITLTGESKKCALCWFLSHYIITFGISQCTVQKT
jgi:hypothetical protein